MSRLLVLLPTVPEPLDTGAKVRNHGLLALLSADHEVDAVGFGSRDSRPHLVRQVARWTVVPEPAPRSSPQRAFDLVRSNLPDIAWRRWSPNFLAAVQCLVRTRAYDAVQAEGLEMARYLCAVAPALRIYDAHNAEFLLQRRFAATSGPALLKAYSTLQWRRLERFERGVVRSSRLTLAVSQHDANQLVALAGQGANVRAIPNAINTAAYPFVAPHAGQASNLLFLGKLDFRPNAEAAEWFLQHVLRPLCARVPDARLFAVGAHPPGWLVRAGQSDNHIAVTGYVPDERAYLARCAALVLPLRTGGGSRLKALIAMASGVPVVSTRLGMEGLDAEPDQDYLVAEQATDWIATLERLLGEPGLRSRLAHNGRALVERSYDWSALRTEAAEAYAWLQE